MMYNSGIKQEVKYNVDTKQKVINDLNRYCSSSLNIFSLLPTKSLYQKRFEYYYNNGMLNQVLQDFINERRIFSDCMIVGQYCLIGRNSQFIFYREILSITFNRNLHHDLPPAWEIEYKNFANNGEVETAKIWLEPSTGKTLKNAFVPKPEARNTLENGNSTVLDRMAELYNSKGGVPMNEHMLFFNYIKGLGISIKSELMDEFGNV